MAGNSQLERAYREYYVATWELSWAWVGLVAFGIMVILGINFSRIYLAMGLEDRAAWAIAFAISALEVIGVVFVLDEDRAEAMRAEGMWKWLLPAATTVAFFAYDIYTNFMGISATIIKIGKLDANSTESFLMTAGAAFLFATSEIFVSWCISAVATHTAKRSEAKKMLNALTGKNKGAPNMGGGGMGGGRPGPFAVPN